MKPSDEEEYGSFYTSRSGNGGRYRYTREYSPSRGHHSNSPATLGDPSPYNLPQGRSYSRSSSGYGTTSRNSMADYQSQPPPCCHQFYHPPPPIPFHSSPSHFNTIPHPPIQCATLNRSCYSRRSNNHPYASYYGATEPSPYADPRSDIYYTSTLTRHPRHSSTRAFPAELEAKIYDAPPPPAGYHPSLPSVNNQHGASGSNAATSGSLRPYAVGMAPMGGLVSGLGVGVSMTGGPAGQQSSSVLRLDEPRLYSSSALQLGSNASTSIQRSSSPQHHPYIDRSISLIRLDNSGNVTGPAAVAGSANPIGGNNSNTIIPDSGAATNVSLASGPSQPRYA